MPNKRPFIIRWIFRLLYAAMIIAPILIWPKGVLTSVAIFGTIFIILWFFLKRKLKQLFAPLEQLARIGEDLELEERNTVKWYHKEAVTATRHDLESLGFDTIASYAVSTMPGTYLMGFLHPEEHTYAALYDQDGTGVHIDFVSRFADGACLTYTNMASPTLLPYPPDKVMVRMEGLDTEALFDRFRQACGDREKAEQPATAFPDAVAQYHKEHMAWIQHHHEDEEALQQALRLRFLEKIGWSAIEWDRKRERVIFIHTKMTPDDVASTYMVYREIHDEATYQTTFEQATTAAQANEPCAAFTALNESLPEAERLEKLIRITEPVLADAYLTPEQCYE